MELTDLLRCPKTGQPLHFDEAASILRGETSDVTYPVIDGIVDFCPQAHDRVTASYDKVAARYDPCITASTLRAKVVGRIIWGRASDRDPMEEVLSLLPDRFDGVLLDVPVGRGCSPPPSTAATRQATIIGVDCSMNMLRKAQARFQEQGVRNVHLLKADAANLPLRDAGVDIVLSMNGWHAFTDKQRTTAEMRRVLRREGTVIACGYVQGARWLSDWFVRRCGVRHGFFTPPFWAAEDLVRQFQDFTITRKGATNPLLGSRPSRHEHEERPQQGKGSEGSFPGLGQAMCPPCAGSTEEPLGERAQAALDRMLVGKRYVFLGEPDHCIVEKYPFRLTVLQHLFARGWRHIAMETGRSLGWRVDRFFETGDASHLHDEPPPSSPDVAIHGKTLGFIDRHENPFHEQLRRLSESRAQGTPRLHYWGYDLDLGMPLGSIEPIQQLLEGHSGQAHELLSAIGKLKGLSTDEQLAQIETLRDNLAAGANTLAGGTFDELQSWLSFLHDSVAAEKRPRLNQDPRGHRLWRAERERLMMRYLDEIVGALGADERLILMGHNGHLSKDASRLWFHPQQSGFWGFRSWLRALGYEAFFKLTGYPANMGDSVGAHLHRRFPGRVLSIWMLYGQGSLMTPKGPRTVRLRDDTVESLLAQVGDRFLLPLDEANPEAKTILCRANIRSAQGECASADLTAQADALYFVRDIHAA